LDHGAGAVLFPEESVEQGRSGRFAQFLAAQPPWSDLPLLVMARPGAVSTEVAEAIDPLERTLAQFGRGSPNIFDVRAAQLASTSAVRGALLDTKEASSRFVESADRVFADGRVGDAR
jgi:hypothetical protein